MVKWWDRFWGAAWVVGSAWIGYETARWFALNATPSDLGPLRYVRSITAPLSPLQARRFTERFGAVVLNGTLNGGVVCDRLTINGGGALNAAP